MTYSDKATQLISDLKSMHGKSRELVVELIETLHNEDRLPYDKVRDVVFTELPFISRATIYRALPSEVKRDYTKPIDSKVSYETIERQDTETPLTVQYHSTELPKIDTDTAPVLEVDRPVYKEPDLVAPVGTLAQVLEDKNTGLEQSYHTMNVPVPDSSRVPVPDYTVTTQLLIHNGTGNNIGQFTTDITVHCYPSAKRVTVEPIDKASIRKKVSQ